MAILEQPFYHKTIALYTSVFGSLFDNIKITRASGDVIRVPLANAWQEKANRRLNENPDPSHLRFKQRLPRLSFAFVGLDKDTSRSKNKMHKLTSPYQGGAVQSQYNRVPYNFTYTLNARTKYVDDLLQIIEQVVVYFNPTLNVVVEDNPDLQGETSLAITLQDQTIDTSFDGSYEDPTQIEATFTFVVEGYLYMPTSTSGVIETIKINYHDLSHPDDIIAQDVITGDGV